MVITVWVQLLRGGENIGRADKITLEDDESDLADLCDAVKVKYADDLNGISPARLNVSMARESSEYLELDQTLNGLQTSPRAPLFVHVPALAGGSEQVGLASPLFAMQLTLERHSDARGFRRSLFQWGGQYGAYFNPESDAADFEALPCDGTENSRLLKIDLVFEDKNGRTSFINEVAKTVALGWEEALVRPWPRVTEGNPKSLDHALKEFTVSGPSRELRRVLANNYVPRGKEAEPPEDSPDPDGGTESSRSTKRELISPKDPLCKRARIESEATIDNAYSMIQKAHIIPKCKCGLSSDKKAGVADLFWLAKLEHNFLPLTPNLHEAFDGTGKGSGTKTESQTVVAFQPLPAVRDDNDRGMRIPLRAWCVEQGKAQALARNLEAQAVVLPVQLGDRTLYVVHGSGVATYGSKTTQVIPTNSDNVVGAIPLWPSSIDRVEAAEGFETLKIDRMDGWEITWACLRWNFHAKICGEWHILPHPLASNDTGSALLTTHSTKERLQAANWIDQKMDESFRDALRTP
ncbi:hypothetical protein AB1Y20_022741 [Prymnesium parvum]|uniref:HNH nuclease domain-containing protein n=1 Tax=Prymnesium parvum TaxID=97485 RepID=A0AB34JH33_PRYPA